MFMDKGILFFILQLYIHDDLLGITVAKLFLVPVVQSVIVVWK